MRTNYKTMTSDFVETFAPVGSDRREFTTQLVRNLRRVTAVPCAQSIDHYLDQLTAADLRQMYNFEHSNDPVQSNVLKMICFQFALLNGAGEWVNDEELEMVHADARQRVADKLGWEL